MKFPMLKQCLSRVGAVVPRQTIHYANGVLNYLYLGRWFRERHLVVQVRCNGREQLYDEVAKHVQEPASYLEFGVFGGTSFRYWTRLLKHPQTFFHGFDSFVGLPEDWNIMVDRKAFDKDGIMPDFDDPRVKLFKGWFSETVPNYVRDFKPHSNLVVHLDADLYSSTALVLGQLRPFIIPGTILMFDELFDREHELKALTEFLDATKLRIECLAATSALTQAAFRITR
jgi:hypothetical protein